MPRLAWPKWLMTTVMIGVVCGGTAVAEEKTVYTAEEVSTLLKRLEESESRIDEFEAKLKRVEENQLKLESNDQNIVEFISAQEVPPAPPAATEESESEKDAVDSGTFDEFLEETEKRWEEQLDTNKALEKSIKGSVQPGGKDITMKLSGRIHLDHWAFPGDSPGTNAFETGNADNDPDDRIAFRRIRFGVGGDIWENMLYKIEMEFAGGNDVEFRDVYLGFEHLPYLQTVLIGNQKRPYGLDHLNSSRYNVFLERPFVIEAFNQDARRVGIQSYGVSDDLAYNWRYGVFNQRLIQDEGAYISDHYQLEVAGRLAHTYWYDECSDGRGYAHFGISGSVAHPDGSAGADAPNDLGRDQNEARFRHRPEARSTNRWLDTGRIAGAQWYELIGLEKVINVGPTQIVGEYQYIFMQNEAGINPDMQFHGGYAYISYFLTGEHIPWDRESGTLGRVKPFENFFLVDRCSGGTGGGWGAWQVAFRYSYCDLTDETVLGGVGSNYTLGLNWHWNPHAKIQFNYIYGEIDERSVTDINGDTYSGGHYHIAGTRFVVDF